MGVADLTCESVGVPGLAQVSGVLAAMVTLADLRGVVHAEPFVPFAVVMADGERFFVGESLHIAIGSERVCTVWCHRSTVHIRVELAMISHLDPDPAEASRTS
jgi:hypothetical protein